MGIAEFYPTHTGLIDLFLVLSAAWLVVLHLSRRVIWPRFRPRIKPLFGTSKTSKPT